MSTLLPEFIKFIDIGSKTLLMYSEKHPRSQQAMERAYAMLNEAIGQRDSVTISLAEGNLLLEGELVDRGNPVLERFAKDLFARSIHSLTFQKGIQPEELVTLLRDLNLKPQKIKEMGGFEKILLDGGAKNIQINKVKYGIISGEEMAGIDQGMLSELLMAVQSMLSGAGDTGMSAQSLEQSLDNTAHPDPAGLLFRILHSIAQKAPTASDQPSEGPLKQRFVDLFRSFTPTMQGKLLLSAILKSASLEKTPMSNFYRELTPAELEKSLLALADQPISEQELRDVFVTLKNDTAVELTETVQKKWEDVGIIKSEALEPQPWEVILKKENLDRSDFEAIPESLKMLIAEGNLAEADKLSRRVFGYLSLGKPEQKLAAIETVPPVILALSQNERWKNVDFSACMLVSTCFRRETDVNVLQGFSAYLLDAFRKNFEKLQFPTCHDLLTVLRSRAELEESLRARMLQQLPALSPFFRDEIGRGFEGGETALQYLKTCREAGIDFLMDWLSDEEDRQVRSRIIAYLGKFQETEITNRIEHRLSDPRWYVVRNMVTIISKLNVRENPPFLKHAASHSDPRVAKEVIKILYKNCAKSDFPLVLALLQNHDKSVRLQAIHLAMMQQFTEAVPELLRHLDFTSPVDADLRAVVYQALLKLKAQEALPFAQALLEKRAAGKIELPERNAAVRILGELGTEASKDLLRKVAQTDVNMETRTLAAGYIR